MRRALFILLALAAPAFPDLATAEQLTAQGQSPANVSTTVAPSPARQMQTKQDEIEEEVLEEEEKEEKELEEEEENSALQLVVIVSLLALALVVGRIMHRRHILSIPESGVTILVGLFTGFAVHFLFPGQSVREQSFYFDPEFFSLFLLPPIIFESGFSLNQALFFRNFGSILTFAVVGTLISTALMWTLIYSLGQAGFIFHLSMVEAGAFSALISAVDPVATLATFSALQADPELHNLVFGESVLNDAVSIVVFRSILEFYLTPFYAHNIPSVVLAFFKTATFSAVIGFFVAAAAALTFKGLGMAHHAGDGDLSAAVFECSLFWAFSYLSYVASEALYLSGIVSTLFAGIFMARYVTPNLTRRGLRLTAGAYRVIATLADFLVFLLVGMAIVVYYADINHMYWRFFLVSFAGCIATRALNIFPLAFILNRCFRTKPIPRKFQYVMWFSGLRGAIAVALSVQLPGPRKGAVIVNTMFVVLASIFLLGGGTFRLLQRLEIQMGGSRRCGRRARPRPRRRARMRSEASPPGSLASSSAWCSPSWWTTPSRGTRRRGATRTHSVWAPTRRPSWA